MVLSLLRYPSWFWQCYGLDVFYSSDLQFLFQMFGTIPKVPITISFTATFHSFFSSLARSKYLFTFLLLFLFSGLLEFFFFSTGPLFARNRHPLFGSILGCSIGVLRAYNAAEIHLSLITITKRRSKHWKMDNLFTVWRTERQKLRY